MNDVPRVAHNDWSVLRVPELGAWQPTLSVSVVIPAYNCQPSLDLALASLTQQTYPAELTEVVVVDDGSRPRLGLPKIRPRNTRLIWVPDLTDEWGIASACNVGVRKTGGEIVLRLDADMVVFPDHIEAHVRWHHEIPYAVTLGYKRFVEVSPGTPEWPSPDQVVGAPAAQRLFAIADTNNHDYVERLISRTDRLRTANHLVFRAHVGATVAVRRQMYEAAGGYDARLRRGSDTEFGYRLTQAGAVFVPEPAARGWHLGRSGMMRDRQRLQRYSRPFLADRMPHPRWLRREGGSGWAVPLVVAVVEVSTHSLELVRAAVDAILANDERDLLVYLVGAWDTLAGEPRSVLLDPHLDLRLIAATYRSDPRVRLAERAPETAFPSPYLLRVPVIAGLGRSAIRQLVDNADRHEVGLVHVDLSGDGVSVELWRTAAVSRAGWVRLSDESLAAVVEATHGVRAYAPTAVGVADLSRISTMGSPGIGDVRPRCRLPATVEVGGLRSWARATALVATLCARRVWDLVRGRLVWDLVRNRRRRPS